jgi:hypothetical protein
LAAPNSTFEAMRRSTRIRADIPVRVRSLEPLHPFDILTRTLIINAQGCGIQSPSDLPVGIPVELVVEERTVSGKILNSTPVDAERGMWVTGIQLDQSGNIWGLASPPADWGAEVPQAAAAPGPAAVAHPFAKPKAPRPVLVTKPAAAAAKREETVAPPDPEMMRARLESLVDELGARLRTQASADWEQWRAQATATLETIHKDLHGSLAADADRWREETQKSTEALAAILQKGDEQARSIEEQASRFAAMVAAAQADIAAAATPQPTEPGGAPVNADALRAEMARVETQLREFAEQAPAQLDRVLQERTEKAIAALTGDTEQKFSQVLSERAQQLQDRLHEMSKAADLEVRGRLVAEYDRREQAYLAMADARAAEMESRAVALRSTADELTAQISRAAEQSMGHMRVRLEELMAQHHDTMTSRLSAQADEVARQLGSGNERFAALMSAAEKALEQIDQHQRSAGSAHSELMKAAEAALEKIDAQQTLAASVIEQATTQSLGKIDSEFAAGQQQLAENLQRHSWEYEAQAEAASERLQGRLDAAIEKLRTAADENQAALSATLAADAAAAAEGIQVLLRTENERQVTDLRAAGEKQAAALRQQLQQEVREGISTLEARQKQIAEDMNALEAQRSQVAAQAAELREVRSSIESLVAGISETVRSLAQRHAAEASEQFRARYEQSLSETLTSETQRSAARLAEELSASARELREKMASDAEQTVAQLQSNLAAVLSARQAEMARDLDDRAATLATHSEAAQQRVEAAVKKSEHLLAETEAALYKSSGEIVGEELARARAALESAAREQREEALASLRSDSCRIVGEQVQAADAAAQRAHAAAEQLRGLQLAREAETQALQQQIEEARQWLEQHTVEFQKTVHDAFLQAGGEIRGRVHAAADNADEIIRQRSKDAMAAVESAVALHAAALDRKAEEVQKQISAIQSGVSQDADLELKAKLAETLERFRTDAARLAESATSRWQTAMEGTLRSIPDLLRGQLEPPAKSAEQKAGG